MITGPNWTRRYGSATPRSCARAGCGAPAAATLRFQPTRREAWLVDLDEGAPRTEGDLCTRHATALVLPRGWALYDDRGAGGGWPARPSEPAPRAAPIEERADAQPQPQAPADPARDQVAASVATADPTGRAADGDDLVASVDAGTPLLQRAFENVTSPGPATSPHIRPTAADSRRRRPRPDRPR